MTPGQRGLILALVTAPGGPEPIATHSVLSAFGMTDGIELVRRLVQESVASRSAMDLELALIGASVFGIPDDLGDLLIDLLDADWHHSHEELVSLLGQLRARRAVPALTRMAVWIPGYLEFDESRALARKAIHALAHIPGNEATNALEALAASGPPELAKVAQRQLMRRT